MNEAVLPYAGTSGWSGSESSKQRAIEQDKNGTTSRNQLITLRSMDLNQEWGVTWKEMSKWEGWHHGTASGVLSVLHKAGKIVRLKETRNRCAVYVLPEWVQNREIAERKVKCCKHCGGEL